MEWIRENLVDINRQIEEACHRVGRSIDEITLIGVCKTVDPELIEASIQMGVAHLGENKPQEIVRKHPMVHYPAKWHMIGNLQTNKVKQIIGLVAMIQSVDSLRLAEEISKRAEAFGIEMPVLIQVNIGNEPQKGGFLEVDLESVCKRIADLPGIAVHGLMCIAPFFDNPEAVRPYFKRMKIHFEELKKIEYNKLHMLQLSMGMTGDFEVAIEEGATMIRVGTGLYGARHY